MKIEITEGQVKDLKLIRNYFGEHDKTQLEHMAFDVIGHIINCASSIQQQSSAEEVNDAEQELLEASGQWQELEHSLGIKCPQLSVLLSMAKTRIDRLTHEQAIPSPPEKETGKGEENKAE